MKKNGGNMLAVFLGILLLAVIILPLVIQLLQNESKQSVNHQKSTVAFQLAEAAVAKGIMKLTETRKNYTDASAGIPLARFNDDFEFTDMSGGPYKVKIASGNVLGTVRIIGKGRDTSSREVRVIETEYTGIDPRAPAVIYNLGTSFQTLFPHWGSIHSYDFLGYWGSETYPRTYSKIGISWRDENPSPPNTNNVDYWSFQPDMTSPPVPDLAYYKDKALNSVFPSSTTTGEIRYDDGTPVPRTNSSGYFEPALWNYWHISFGKKGLLEGMGNMYEIRSSTSVLYLNNTTLIPHHTLLREVFLDVEAVIGEPYPPVFLGSTVPYHIYGATIPENAPYEYQGTTLGRWGYPSAQTIWANNFAATFALPNHCCYSIPNANFKNNIQVHGYVYVGGFPTAFVAGNFSMQGVLQVNESGQSTSSCFVFYDPNVLKNVVWSKAPLYRLSWKESSEPW